MSNLAYKLGQPVPKWDKSEFFKTSFSTFWRRVPDMSHFGPIWPNLDAKFDISGTSGDAAKNSRILVRHGRLLHDFDKTRYILSPYLRHISSYRSGYMFRQDCQICPNIMPDWFPVGHIWEFLKISFQQTENWSSKVPDLTSWCNLGPNLTSIGLEFSILDTQILRTTQLICLSNHFVCYAFLSRILHSNTDMSDCPQTRLDWPKMEQIRDSNYPGLFQIRFQSWSENVLRSDLEKSWICHISGQSDPFYGSIWDPLWQGVL